MFNTAGFFIKHPAETCDTITGKRRRTGNIKEELSMNRNDINRLNTINAIKESFITLYEKKGIDNVSVREICEMTGVSRTIFYKYFDDKYQILEEIEDEVLQATRSMNVNLRDEPLRKYADGTMFDSLLNTITYIYNKRRYFKPLMGPNGDSRFLFRWKKQIREDVSRGTENTSSDLYKIAGSGVVNDLFASICIGIYTYWFYENPGLSVEQIAKMESYLLYALFVKV